MRSADAPRGCVADLGAYLAVDCQPSATLPLNALRRARDEPDAATYALTFAEFADR
jgi:hypothetical protein